MTKNQPMYAQIAGHFRDLIESGELAKGAKLPSVADISKEWGVAKATVDSAISQLKTEGLIDVRRGARATVRNIVPLMRIAPERYFRPHNQPTWLREAERAGRTVNLDYLSERVDAPAAVADRLNIAEGEPVIRTRYLITMDDEPVSMSAAYEPYAIVGGTDVERPHEGPLANKGIIPRFDSIGVHIDEVEEVLNFRAPTAEEAEKLKLGSGDRVVEITQTFRADGLPTETADIVFAGDRYELHYRMQIPVNHEGEK